VPSRNGKKGKKEKKTRFGGSRVSRLNEKEGETAAQLKESAPGSKKLYTGLRKEKKGRGVRAKRRSLPGKKNPKTGRPQPMKTKKGEQGGTFA